jgi:hypothetical protein
MAVGALTASLLDLARWMKRRWITRPAVWRSARWAAAAIVALPLLSVLKDGAATIRFARETGGRYNSGMIQSDIDKIQAAQWYLARARALPTDKVAFHTGLVFIHWSWSWELRPHALIQNQPIGNAAAAAVARFYFLDTRYATGAELKQAATTFHVYAIGPYWLFDRSEPPASLDGFSFDEREPNPWEWFVQGGTEPVRKVVPDPWMTWEWRTVVDQNVEAPTGRPQTLEQIRVAHNIAVSRKESVRAAELRAALAAGLSSPPTSRYDNGAELLGIRHHQGAQRSLTAYFLGAPSKGRAKFAINSRVDSGPWLSTLPFDQAELDLAHPPMIGTELWRRGLIYSVKFPYRKRPGTERFYGWFHHLDAQPTPLCVAANPPPRPQNPALKAAASPAVVDLIRLKDRF